MSQIPRQVPTKQRAGDQRLPEGGRECIQDVIIEEMERSKRVGLERYGQTLMTFNGRKGLQDVAEEARDLHVYTAMLAREGEATREELIEVIRELLGDEGQSELVVDRLMGWVAARLSQSAPPTDANTPRRFRLVRERDISGVSGVGLVAWGVEFPDGRAAVRWNSEIAQTCAWDSMEHIERIHGHGGATRVEWLDD